MADVTLRNDVSGPLLRARLVRPKTVVFALIALMTLYVLYHNERFLLDPPTPPGGTSRASSGGCCRTALPASARCCWRRCSFPTRCARGTPRCTG